MNNYLNNTINISAEKAKSVLVYFHMIIVSLKNRIFNLKQNIY